MLLYKFLFCGLEDQTPSYLVLYSKSKGESSEIYNSEVDLLFLTTININYMKDVSWQVVRKFFEDSTYGNDSS